MNDDKIHIIHYLDNNSKYGYEGIIQTKIELYRSTLFKVDNVEKPIKSISSYKVLYSLIHSINYNYSIDYNDYSIYYNDYSIDEYYID